VPEGKAFEKIADKNQGAGQETTIGRTTTITELPPEEGMMGKRNRKQETMDVPNKRKTALPCGGAKSMRGGTPIENATVLGEHH